MRKFLALTICAVWVVLGIAGCATDSQPTAAGEPAGTLVAAKRAPSDDGDAHILAVMRQINEQLAAWDLNFAVEEVAFFTIGQGRPANRIHQQFFPCECQSFINNHFHTEPGIRTTDWAFVPFVPQPVKRMSQ